MGGFTNRPQDQRLLVAFFFGVMRGRAFGALLFAGRAVAALLVNAFFGLLVVAGSTMSSSSSSLTVVLAGVATLPLIVRRSTRPISAYCATPTIFDTIQ